MTQLATIEEILTPLGIIMIGLVFGIILGTSARRGGSGGKLLAVSWAATSGAAIWVMALTDYSNLIKSTIFTNLSQLLGYWARSALIFGNVRMITAMALIGLYELGFVLGCAGAPSRRRKATIHEQIQSTTVPQQSNRLLLDTKRETLNYPEVDSEFSKVESRSQLNPPSTQSPDYLDPITLDRDERNIVDLLIFGNTESIAPRVDVSKTEGYYFEGLSSLKIETERLRQLLDSLVLKKILVAQLSDKLIVCRECASPNLQLRKMCPECMSVQLSKHYMLEHFACGLIDKQESFGVASEDFVCPKCGLRLHLAGSDYRNVSPMYICLECNSINKDILQLMKCGACGTTSEVGEESERYLYSYSLNQDVTERLADYIKPVEACSAYFRSFGYVVVAPAFLTGRSGKSHVFDVLVLPSSQERNSCAVQGDGLSDSHGIIVEILASTNPIELTELTRVYEKASDVDSNVLVLAIPSLSPDSRHYAKNSKIKIVEGRSIHDALRNPKVASLAAEVIPSEDEKFMWGV